MRALTAIDEFNGKRDESIQALFLVDMETRRGGMITGESQVSNEIIVDTSSCEII